jgi:hypothetical protein
MEAQARSPPLSRLCMPTIGFREALFCSSGGEVVGPGAACVDDPADRSVDVHAEQVGEDGGGQIGCEGGECSVAADRTLMPWRFSLVVRRWLAIGCPGTRPGNNLRGPSKSWEILSRSCGSVARRCRSLARRGGNRIGWWPAVR